MDKILNDLTSLVVPAAKNLIVALLVFVIGFKVINILSKYLKNRKGLKNADPSASTFIVSFITISLKVLVIVSVVAILGVPMSSIVALVASAGVAVGLAVQGALSNLVGGVMILLFRPFKVGDYVEAQGVSGTVQEISVIYTSLLTPDNKFITVPNGTLTNSVITNYSTEKLRRVDIDISTNYNVNIEMVKNLLIKTANENSNVIDEPAPEVVIVNCGESSVNFALRVWCENAEYWNVKNGLTERVRLVFVENDIEVPYPKMDVRVKNDK